MDSPWSMNPASAEYLQAVRTICDHLGIDYHRVVTDQPLELALFDFLAARQQVKQPTMRKQRGGGGSGSALTGAAAGRTP